MKELKERSILKQNLKDVQNTPWGIYNKLCLSEVMKTYYNEGFEVANEIIRCSDIRAYRAYRAEEAACGNI